MVAGSFPMQLPRHLRHVAAQNRRQIAVDHGGIAAADELDQRRHFVTGRHLRKTEVASQSGELPLVRLVAVGMHQHDGDRANAVGFGAFERASRRFKIEFALDGAIGTNALVDLHHAFVQHVRFDDMLGEDLRPCLVADAQRVAETFGDQKQRPLALALEQRVGRHRGAHLNGADALTRNRSARRQSKQVPDAVHGRIAVSFRIL